MTEAVLHVSSLAGSPLLESGGARLGRVDDVVATLHDPSGLPRVIGLTARIGGRVLFVPIDRVERLEQTAARSATTKLDLAQFERREGEVLLRGDLLDHSLINIKTARLVRAREVELVCSDGVWRVAGIDPTLRPRLSRLLPRRFRNHEPTEREFVPWTDIEPFVSHVPSSRLKLRPLRLGRLHPAQIADLVEAASHDEGEEILDAVGEDKELEADVFEELDDTHQIEFLSERSDDEVAELLSRMASDDVADLLLELDQERRAPILRKLPARKQRAVMTLLGHNPSTAGGLMNPDYMALPGATTASEALELIRRSDLSDQQLAVVCVLDEAGALIGTLPLAELIRRGSGSAVSELIEAPTPTVTAEADLPEVALLMTDFNLTAMPVVDGSGVPLGMIAVDDLLDVILPADWRRRAGSARD